MRLHGRLADARPSELSVELPAPEVVEFELWSTENPTPMPWWDGQRWRGAGSGGSESIDLYDGTSGFATG